ncbi:hypothetical protein MHYP_G00177180 [Metynnis hypsauchen]
MVELLHVWRAQHAAAAATGLERCVTVLLLPITCSVQAGGWFLSLKLEQQSQQLLMKPLDNLLCTECSPNPQHGIMNSGAICGPLGDRGSHARAIGDKAPCQLPGARRNEGEREAILREISLKQLRWLDWHTRNG